MSVSYEQLNVTSHIDKHWADDHQLPEISSLLSFLFPNTCDAVSPLVHLCGRYLLNSFSELDTSARFQSCSGEQNTWLALMELKYCWMWEHCRSRKQYTSLLTDTFFLPLSLKAVLLQTVLCIGIYPLTPWQQRNSNLLEGKTRSIVSTLTVLRMIGLLALSPTRGRRPRSPRFLSFSKQPFSWSRLLWALNIQWQWSWDWFFLPELTVSESVERFLCKNKLFEYSVLSV